MKKNIINLLSITMFALTIGLFDSCYGLFHDSQRPVNMDAWLHDKLHN